MFNRLTTGVRAASPRPSSRPDYRLIYCGDSNVHSGYISAPNKKMRVRPSLILGEDTALASDDAVGGMRIDEVQAHLEGLTPPVSTRHPDSYIKIMIVGAATNDFFNSPRDSVAQVVADYQALNTYYGALPGFIVIPMTCPKATTNMDLITPFHSDFMLNYTGYGFTHVIDTYQAVKADLSDLLDAVHLDESAHIKASWLIAAAIDEANIGINRLPVTYWVLNKPDYADNLTLYNAIRDKIALYGLDNPPRVDNGDGVRIALRCNPEVLRVYNNSVSFQADLQSAFDDLDPLNQLIDVLTASDTVQTGLPSGDGWPA